MHRKPRTLSSILIHAVLIVMAAINLTPIFWLTCAAFKRSDDSFAYAFLPWRHLERLTLDNFRQLFEMEPFGKWLINSIFLASAYSVSVVTLSSLGGFALAKYRFRGKKSLMLLLLVTMLLPSQVLLGSLYELM
ncbi:MAG TPA: hypothetical protein VL992_07170, partial [Tepidisphaeraceae bacterium]|nr:hypothetical protein [Tepidisphaeraceae bacterium]